MRPKEDALSLERYGKDVEGRVDGTVVSVSEIFVHCNQVEN